jgi:hypothetical protein
MSSDEEELKIIEGDGGTGTSPNTEVRITHRDSSDPDSLKETYIDANPDSLFQHLSHLSIVNRET